MCLQLVVLWKGGREGGGAGLRIHHCPQPSTSVAHGACSAKTNTVPEAICGRSLHHKPVRRSASGTVYSAGHFFIDMENGECQILYWIREGGGDHSRGRHVSGLCLWTSEAHRATSLASLARPCAPAGRPPAPGPLEAAETKGGIPGLREGPAEVWGGFRKRPY